jgi:hypothetical protein
MTVSTFRLAPQGIALPEAVPVAGRRRPLRAFAAIGFLAVVGSIIVGSLFVSGDEWSVARARSKAPASQFGPIDPNC